jgi:glycosyltransferase involved in cell wall biosynthesis
VFEAVVAHAELVRRCGYEPVVIGLEDPDTDADRARFGAVKVRALRVRGPGMIGYAPGLKRALLDLDLDLLHLHGIWMYPSRAAGDWAAATGRPYVVSPHGMLDPWITARGVAKKAVARIAYERRSWRLAACLHALTGREAEDIRREAPGARTVVIPNAVATDTHAADTDARTILYLGRIHPKKNLDRLVEGWTIADPRGQARLVIAGWGDDADVAALRSRLAALGRDDVAFVGPVFGDAKRALLTEARFLALPSHSEGLPVAILEAWAAGTPTLMSKHCNLPAGFDRGAAIDCGTSAEAIAATLTRALALDEPEWRAMSAAASALAADTFAPEVVARAWGDAYAGLLRPRMPVAA